MRILMRSSTKHNWTEVESASYEGESDLQALLANSPGLLPVDELGEGVQRFVLAVREYGLPGSGSTDILLFNPDGEIGLVECKLRTNDQIKREVVGQILEYAAHLWKTSYSDLDKRIAATGGAGLADQVAALAGTPDWDESAFRDGVSKVLSEGTFHLFVAVDKVNAELKRIVDYLNETGATAFTFHALELERYRNGDAEMLVPHLYGKVPGGKPGRRAWTEDGYMTQARRDLGAKELEILRDIYDWSCHEADEVYFGTGSQTASFTFHFRENGKTVSVFTLYSDGRLVMNYEYLTKQISAERLQAFHAHLRDQPPFSSLPKKMTGFVSIELKHIASAGSAAVQHLKDAVAALRSRKQD